MINIDTTKPGSVKLSFSDLLNTLIPTPQALIIAITCPQSSPDYSISYSGNALPPIVSARHSLTVKEINISGFSTKTPACMNIDLYKLQLANSTDS